MFRHLHRMAPDREVVSGAEQDEQEQDYIESGGSGGGGLATV